MFRIDNTKASEKNADGDAPGTCAACGKSALDLQIDKGGIGEESRARLKCCTACFSVRYCGVPCQKKHRKQHRKECEENANKRRAFNDALLEKEISSDITHLPPQPDCDLCMYMMPPGMTASKFLGCCGKIICRACFSRSAAPGFMDLMKMYGGKESHSVEERMRAMMQVFGEGGSCSKETQGSRRCPFCRSSDDMVQYTKEHHAKRERCLESIADKGNSRAVLELAQVHQRGFSAAALANSNASDDSIFASTGNVMRGNITHEGGMKALEYFNKAADMDNADAYYVLSNKYRLAYNADDYFLCLSKAVNLGSIEARDDLAMLAMQKKQKHIAMEHYKILAAVGYGKNTTSTLTAGYKEGCVTKDELEAALRAYHAARKEIFSEERARFELMNVGVSADGKVKVPGAFM
jgi:hypothetical protein